MIRKIMTFMVSICLVLCSGLPVLAETDKTVYVEYSKEEGKNTYYPKVGFDWKINYNWSFTASHQFNFDEGNGGTTDLEIRRAFLDQELYWALKYENSVSYDSIGLSVNAAIPINDSLSYNGTISYTPYFAHRNNPDNLDYNLLDILSGVEYRINDKLFTLLSCEWSNYQYAKNAAVLSSNPDYSKLEFSTGLGFQFSENFSMKGVYSWADTKYVDPQLNEHWGGVTISVNYTFKKNYTFYLEYPLYQKDIAMIGLSYDF